MTLCNAQIDYHFVDILFLKKNLSLNESFFCFLAVMKYLFIPPSLHSLQHWVSLSSTIVVDSFLHVEGNNYSWVLNRCPLANREFTQHDASAHDEPKESRN